MRFGSYNQVPENLSWVVAEAIIGPVDAGCSPLSLAAS